VTATFAAGAVRPWLPSAAAAREAELVARLDGLDAASLLSHLDDAVAAHRHTHEDRCVNLNPAANVMNPRAEAMLAAGLGSRPSLGWPGAKYETGLQAAETIEVQAAALSRRVFHARHAEVRVGSGAIANLYAFLATCRPGDAIVAPPASIGGHVTHHRAGAAGLAGLITHPAPVDASRFTVDVDVLAEMAERVKPRLITIGGSLNLHPHPVRQIRKVADRVGALVLFDAAHVCGLVAGGVWPNPLDEGAHLMTMSTYKSLGGPPGGLVLTNDDELAERIDAIAYPGLTANFDLGKVAALAVTMVDWLTVGSSYAQTMVDNAAALARALAERGLTPSARTTSHQFAIDAVTSHGGGDAAARHLERANLLASAIGLPGRTGADGVRIGTPELTRWGMTPTDMPTLADLVADAWHGDPASVADRTTAFRRRFTDIHFTAG
jgi:glycine hydroxymethyltransferase